MEDIESFDCFWSALLVTKDEINPQMKICGNVVALQRLPMLLNEEDRIAFGPRRQLNIINLATSLCRSKIEPVSIDEEFRKVEELGRELSNVTSRDFRGRSPGLLN